MNEFSIFRLTALPVTLVPYSIYIIAPPSKPDYVEIYVTNALGTATKRVINEADVMGLIANALSSFSTLEVVDDIDARNALTPTSNTPVYVIDASDDPTVTSGGASYIYRVSTQTWIKTAEAESLDVVLQWVNIQGKPSSSASAIDTAVTNSHTHSNKTQLDLIDENADQRFTYRGALPVIAWTEVEW